MTLATESVATRATQTLTLTEELLLMLLNEESGYFHQVPGWDLELHGRRAPRSRSCRSSLASTRTWSP